MITKWETPQERTRRLMKIPVKKKMKLLEELHRMAVKTSSKRLLKIRLKLRERNSLGNFK